MCSHFSFWIKNNFISHPPFFPPYLPPVCSLVQWSSAQSYKASNPAGFSVLPGRRLLSPGIRFLCQAWVGQKTWTACRTGLFIKRRKKTGKSLCSLIPLIVSVSLSCCVFPQMSLSSVFHFYVKLILWSRPTMVVHLWARLASIPNKTLCSSRQEGGRI